MSWDPVVYDKNGRTKWGWMAQHRDGLELGRADIGAFTYINARYGVIIEDDVQIGSHCSIYSHSTIDNKQGKVRILRGARVGAHSIIMPGVTVGAHALVAACSFVNKDVPDFGRVAGVPAKPMRERQKWATTEEALAFLDRKSHHD
jgi:acetyltransferase-like isoleucine patch superfamily enzyme